VGEFEFRGGGVGQHVCRQVRENRAGTGDLRAVLDQVGVPKWNGTGLSQKYASAIRRSVSSATVIRLS